MRRIYWQTFRPITKTGLPFMKSVIQLLAKYVLIPMELIAATTVVDAEKHKNILGSGQNTALVTSNGEMEDVLKIVKSFEDTGLLLEGGSKKIKNEAKEEKGGFFSMLLSLFGAS